MLELIVPSGPVEGIGKMTFANAVHSCTRSLRARLLVELLEARDIPSFAPLAPDSGPFYPTVMAGDPRSEVTDSPDLRVDPNSLSSVFGGVGSLLVTTKKTSFVGSATVIGPRHILTAAHVVDLNGDGKVNARDGSTGVYFILNLGGDQSHKFAIAKFDIHPNFTGFNRPAVNDDLAVLTLAEDLPDNVPVYSLPSRDLMAGSTLTIVGYGRSGDGVRGYLTDASLTVKRVGENIVDAFYGQDDRGQQSANEAYRFDFDGPKGNGPLGGPSLGNDRETQLGTGDSGGPAFVHTDTGYVLAGVNSFVQGSNAPKFGSMAGGVNVFAYLGFINSILPVAVPAEIDRPPTVGSEPPPVVQPPPVVEPPPVIEPPAVVPPPPVIEPPEVVEPPPVIQPPALQPLATTDVAVVLPVYVPIEIQMKPGIGIGARRVSGELGSYHSFLGREIPASELFGFVNSASLVEAGLSVDVGLLSLAWGNAGFARKV
jgi:hypothetical protein